MTPERARIASGLNGAAVLLLREIVCTRCAARFEAGAPVFRQFAVLELVAFGEGGPRPVRGIRPWLAVRELDFVHAPAIVVLQSDAFPGIVDGIAERTEHAGDTRGRRKGRRIRRHHDELSRPDYRARRKIKVDPAVDTPAGKVYIDRILVLQFDPFARRLAIGGVVMDFVEGDDRIDAGRGGAGESSGSGEQEGQTHGEGGWLQCANLRDAAAKVPKIRELLAGKRDCATMASRNR